MGYLLIKAALSGIIIAIFSEVARRAPGLGTYNSLQNETSAFGP
jgi:hypothetical protein